MEEFIETNDQYGSGFVIAEYQGRYSLIAARKSGDKVYQKWGEIEVAKDKTKRLPVSVELGSSKDEAIGALALAIRFLDGNESPF
jgi:hypothetical protein